MNFRQVPCGPGIDVTTAKPTTLLYVLRLLSFRLMFQFLHCAVEDEKGSMKCSFRQVQRNDRVRHQANQHEVPVQTEV